MMKNISCSLFAALLVVSACSDAKKDEASSSNALQSEAKVVSATETRDETPPSVAEKAPEPEAGPAYSDEIADQLIAQVDACESAIMGCDAADQLAAFGTKATGRLVAAVTAPDVEMERVVNLSFIIEKVKDPAAAQPLFESAKPQRGKPINPLLLTSMRLGDEAFYSMLLAKADAGSKRDMLAFQITSYAGSMCLTRNELADPLFSWAGKHAKKGSASHASVLEGCAPYVKDKDAAKASLSEMLEKTKDKGARIRLANASFALGDFSKAKVWIDLAKDRAYGGSARIAVVSNAKDIPEDLKAGAIEAVELSIEAAKKYELSATQAEEALELLK